MPAGGLPGHENPIWLAAALAALDEAVITISLDTTIRSWNPAAEALFGYSAAEVIGRSIRLVAPPERVDEQRALLVRIAAGERVYHYRTERLHRDGRLLRVTLNLAPIRENSDAVAGIVEVHRDVIAESPVTSIQRREAERLRLAVHLAGVGTWDWDVHRQHMSWSDTQCALFGLAPGEFGGTWEEALRRVHPEDRGALDAVITDLIAGQRTTFDLAFRAICPDGSERWLEMRAGVPREGAAGQVTHVVGVTLDVERLKAKEAELTSCKRQLTELLGNLPDLVARFERTLQLSYVNLAVEYATGRTAADLLGQGLGALGIPESTVRLGEGALHRILATGSPEHLVIPLPTSHGEHLYQAVGVPELAPDGTIASVLVVGRDVSERARVEQVREELHRELQERERRLYDLIERALSDGRRQAAAAEAERDALLLELTPRERELLRLVAAGKTNAQIGATLALSAGTVRNQLVRLFRKLQVSDRAEAAAQAVRLGLIGA